MNRTAYVLPGAALAAALVLAAGCSDAPSRPSFGGPDADAIVKVVEELTDASQATLKKCFTARALPDQAGRARLSSHSVEIVGAPTVSGDTAKARVKFVSFATSQDAGEKEWAFVKEGGDWKINEAPLP